MVKKLVWRLGCAVACLGVSMVLAAPALAVPLDPSFGAKGAVDLRIETAPKVFEYAVGFAASPEHGDVYLLQDREPCRPAAAGGCAASTSLARLRPDGSRDQGFAGDGTFNLPSLGYAPALRLAIDSRGGALIGWREKQMLSVMRVGANGARDSSFGTDGLVRLRSECDSGGMRILPLAGDKTLVVTACGTANRDSPALLTVDRLAAGGRTDRAYGAAGRTTIGFAGSSMPAYLNVLDGGGLAFLVKGRRGQNPGVGRVGPLGKLDRRYLRRTRSALKILGSGERYFGDLVPRSGGTVDLFGGLGARGFMLRLGPDGRLGGLRLLSRPITAVVGTPAGRSFVISPRLERPAWYSEEGLFSTWLGRDGRPLQGFSRGGERLRWASAFGALALQDNRRPLLFDPGYAFEGCRSYCPTHPALYGFQPR